MYMAWLPLSLLSVILSLTHNALGLGSSCAAPLSSGSAAPTDPYWLESMIHQGTAPFNPTPSTYPVFRNVKDYGAKGTGLVDDTAAINLAMSDGNRCGAGCNSTTITPAIIYFPAGTYLVSSDIHMYFYTQVVGDARNPPTILASPSFSGFAVFDADPYYANTDNFFRSVRNFVFDLRQSPSNTVALHWQVSQSTSLLNLVFQMSTTSGTSQQGIFMDNGSGGMMGDLIFNGGRYGMYVGNQQFTVRNATFTNVQTGVYVIWNWGWNFRNFNFNSCQVAFEIQTGGYTGGTIIADSSASSTPVFVRTSIASPQIGSLLLDNIHLSNVPVAVGTDSGSVVLAGSSGSTTVVSWGQGDVYTGSSGAHSQVQGTLTPPNKPAALLDASGKIVGRMRPQYEGYAASQFVSVKTLGAKGDGINDDTAVITSILAQYAGCKIIFFDAGVYMVSSTITIPAGTQIVGEVWSVLMGYGAAFSDINNPQPVFQVGAPGSTGVIEISDIIFTTRGPTPGAIVLEWNAHDPVGQQAVVGAWDSHIRLGGATGTNLDSLSCSNTAPPTSNCYAAFMGLHITSSASAYIEGMWVWAADHDLDNNLSGGINTYSGRGVYSESQGPVWLTGTASEHHSIENYALVGASNHYMGLIQTETPYYQPYDSFNVPGWRFTACALDQASPRLLSHSVSVSSNTVESCISACANLGYSIAGMEYGGECYCDNKYGFTLQTLPYASCTTPCNGDNGETCGGGWALSVYTALDKVTSPAPSGWKYLGCALDQASPRLLAHVSTSSSNTVESCTAHCASLGYSLAGMEYGTECYCDNSYGFTMQSLAASSCSSPCAGNSGELCGGGWALSLYGSTGVVASTGASGWKYVGCALDQASPRLLAVASSSSTNTVESCITHCSGLGYTIAGMEYGNECYCANSYGFTLQLLSASTCSSACAGSSGEKCGGGWALSVYQLASVSAPSGWQYVGCGLDQASPRLLAHSTSTSTNTVESCITHCSSLGYTIAGMEYGTECYCDNSYGFTLQSLAATSCITPCAGNTTELCGGGWALSLYSVPAPSTPTTTASTFTPGPTLSSINPFPSNVAYNDPAVPAQAWGLRVVSSTGILLYGANLYNFFQEYNSTCVSTLSCQTQIADVDTTSHIYIYSLTTVGVADELSVQESGFALAATNRVGLQSTITSWSQ